MLKFIPNKEKSDSNFKILECELENCRLTIIQWKEQISVFVRRYIYEDTVYLGNIEIVDHRATSLSDAKHLAEKMYDIVLGYKPVEKWKE